MSSGNKDRNSRRGPGPGRGGRSGDEQKDNHHGDHSSRDEHAHSEHGHSEHGHSEHGHGEHGHGARHGEHKHEKGRLGAFFDAHCSTPAEHAMAGLMMTAKMIHRFGESRISKHEQYSKLSGPRMGVLFIVHHSGGIRMGDLAQRLHVAPRTVTDLVDGLERDEFIKRIPDPADRRASIIELSDSTKKDFERIAAMRKAFVEEIFSPLDDNEKELLVALLAKLRDGPIQELLADMKVFDKDKRAGKSE